MSNKEELAMLDRKAGQVKIILIVNGLGIVLLLSIMILDLIGG